MTLNKLANRSKSSKPDIYDEYNSLSPSVILYQMYCFVTGPHSNPLPYPTLSILCVSGIITHSATAADLHFLFLCSGYGRLTRAFWCEM